MPIDLHFYATEKDLLTQLDENVARWIGEARNRARANRHPDAKVVSAERSVARGQAGRRSLDGRPVGDHKILRRSIYRFKGLERLVVAVTELDAAREDVFYVGFSRPNVFLSIFCPESARHRLPRGLLRAA